MTSLAHASGDGKSFVVEGVIAADESIAAMRVVPSVKLVPTLAKLLRESWRFPTEPGCAADKEPCRGLRRVEAVGADPQAGSQGRLVRP
jgi:hypothetical protein